MRQCQGSVSQERDTQYQGSRGSRPPWPMAHLSFQTCELLHPFRD